MFRKVALLLVTALTVYVLSYVVVRSHSYSNSAANRQVIFLGMWDSDLESMYGNTNAGNLRLNTVKVEEVGARMEMVLRVFWVLTRIDQSVTGVAIFEGNSKIF